MAKKIQNEGGEIGYVADSIVYHYHRETWRQISRRFEREIIAYKEIYPNINININDSIRYFFVAIYEDIKHIKTRNIKYFLIEIYYLIFYRFNQFYGTYRGNHIDKKLSNFMKEIYYYPTKSLLNNNDK